MVNAQLLAEAGLAVKSLCVFAVFSGGRKLLTVTNHTVVLSLSKHVSRFALRLVGALRQAQG
jgi:predicted naringenin-chalcone synthase